MLFLFQYRQTQQKPEQLPQNVNFWETSLPKRIETICSLVRYHANPLREDFAHEQMSKYTNVTWANYTYNNRQYPGYKQLIYAITADLPGLCKDFDGLKGEARQKAAAKIGAALYELSAAITKYNSTPQGNGVQGKLQTIPGATQPYIQTFSAYLENTQTTLRDEFSPFMSAIQNPLSLTTPKKLPGATLLASSVEITDPKQYLSDPKKFASLFQSIMNSGGKISEKFIQTNEMVPTMLALSLRDAAVDQLNRTIAPLPGMQGFETTNAAIKILETLYERFGLALVALDASSGSDKLGQLQDRYSLACGKVFQLRNTAVVQSFSFYSGAVPISFGHGQTTGGYINVPRDKTMADSFQKTFGQKIWVGNEQVNLALLTNDPEEQAAVLKGINKGQIYRAGTFEKIAYFIPFIGTAMTYGDMKESFGDGNYVGGSVHLAAFLVSLAFDVATVMSFGAAAPEKIAARKMMGELTNEWLAKNSSAIAKLSGEELTSFLKSGAREILREMPERLTLREGAMLTKTIDMSAIQKAVRQAIKKGEGFDISALVAENLSFGGKKGIFIKGGRFDRLSNQMTDEIVDKMVKSIPNLDKRALAEVVKTEVRTQLGKAVLEGAESRIGREIGLRLEPMLKSALQVSEFSFTGKLPAKVWAVDPGTGRRALLKEIEGGSGDLLLFTKKGAGLELQLKTAGNTTTLSFVTTRKVTEGGVEKTVIEPFEAELRGIRMTNNPGSVSFETRLGDKTITKTMNTGGSGEMKITLNSEPKLKVFSNNKKVGSIRNSRIKVKPEYTSNIGNKSARKLEEVRGAFKNINEFGPNKIATFLPESIMTRSYKVASESGGLVVLFKKGAGWVKATVGEGMERAGEMLKSGLIKLDDFRQFVRNIREITITRAEYSEFNTLGLKLLEFRTAAQVSKLLLEWPAGKIDRQYNPMVSYGEQEVTSGELVHFSVNREIQRRMREGKGSIRIYRRTETVNTATNDKTVPVNLVETRTTAQIERGEDPGGRYAFSTKDIISNNVEKATYVVRLESGTTAEDIGEFTVTVKPKPLEVGMSASTLKAGSDFSISLSPFAGSQVRVAFLKGGQPASNEVYGVTNGIVNLEAPLEPGQYSVELYDVTSGTKISTQSLSVESNTAQMSFQGVPTRVKQSQQFSFMLASTDSLPPAGTVFTADKLLQGITFDPSTRTFTTTIPSGDLGEEYGREQTVKISSAGFEGTLVLTVEKPVEKPVKQPKVKKLGDI